MKTGMRLLVIAAALTVATSARAAQPASQPTTPDPNEPAFSPLAALEPVQVTAIRCDFAAEPRIAPWLSVERSVERHLQDANLPITPAIYVGRRVISPNKPVYRVDACLMSSQDASSYVCHLQSSLSTAVTDPRFPGRTFRADIWRSQPVMLFITADKLVATVTSAAIEQADAFSATCQRARQANPTAQKLAQAPPSIPAVVAPPAEPNKPAINPKDYAFVASKNSTVYHRPTCPAVKRIAVGNLVGYATRQQAEAAGKRPCIICKPDK